MNWNYRRSVTFKISCFAFMKGGCNLKRTWRKRKLAEWSTQPSTCSGRKRGRSVAPKRRTTSEQWSTSCMTGMLCCTLARPQSWTNSWCWTGSGWSMFSSEWSLFNPLKTKSQRSELTGWSSSRMVSWDWSWSNTSGRIWSRHRKRSQAFCFCLRSSVWAADGPKQTDQRYLHLN